MATRTSIRPRPVDVQKQLIIVRNLEELDSTDGIREAELVCVQVRHHSTAKDAVQALALQEDAEYRVVDCIRHMRTRRNTARTSLCLRLAVSPPTIGTTFLSSRSRSHTSTEEVRSSIAIATVTLQHRCTDYTACQPGWQHESPSPGTGSSLTIICLPAGGVGYQVDGYVEYDLDNDDEDWLEKYNQGQTRLQSVKLERMLWKLDVACGEATDRVLTAAGAGPCASQSRQPAAPPADPHHLLQVQHLQPCEHQHAMATSLPDASMLLLPQVPPKQRRTLPPRWQ